MLCPDQASITLNFSRGASNVLGQYYQLLRLGRAGYTRIMSNLDTIAKRLADGVLETGQQHPGLGWLSFCSDLQLPHTIASCILIQISCLQWFCQA